MREHSIGPATRLNRLFHKVHEQRCRLTGFYTVRVDGGDEVQQALAFITGSGAAKDNVFDTAFNFQFISKTNVDCLRVEQKAQRSASTTSKMHIDPGNEII